VIPCFNEAANLRHLLPLLEDILWATHMRWEIIVVDDGSTDDTAAVAEAWCELSGFRCISLSRNFGKEAALTAGLAAATGDAVVLLDGDLQHSPELIHTMVAQWVAGAEVVYAVREQRSDESRFKQIGSKLFYSLVNSSDRFDVPAEEEVTVTGCLATPHDVFGDEVMLPRAEPGDLIAIFCAGAYGLSASPQSWESRPIARELLV